MSAAGAAPAAPAAPAMVHASAAGGFTAATIAVYEKGRPDWDRSQVAFMLDTLGIAPTDAIVELGAGTGKFTRPLLEELQARAGDGTALNVLVTEPMSMGDHLPQHVKAYLGVSCLTTTADKLPSVASGSVSLVVAAQAFHWFANDASLAEIRRILKPGGHFVACWNVRDRSPASGMAALEDLMDSFCDAATPRKVTMEWLTVLQAFPGLGPVEYRKLDRPPHVTTVEGLVHWVTSISYIAKRSAEEKAAIAARVRLILTASAAADGASSGAGAHASAGVGGTAADAPITVPMFTDVYWVTKTTADHPGMVTPAAAATTVAAVHASAAEGFTAATIGVYERARPDWDRSQVAFMLDTLGVPPTAPIVELGAGTGKFTRPLLEELQRRAGDGAALSLVVTEPTSMGACLPDLVKGHAGVSCLTTAADKLAGCADGSASLVVGAQCFHWFANEASLAEISRVLKPGGHFVVCWNMRERSPTAPIGRLEMLLDEYYDDSTPRQHTKEWLPVLESWPAFEGLQHRKLDRPAHTAPADGIVQWVLSISVVAKRSPVEKAAIEARIRALLAADDMPFTTAADGTRLYDVPMYTDWYWCAKKAAPAGSAAA